MNNMKCPFCGQKLDTDYHYISCHNPHCNITVDMEGAEEMWEALIRTRKALKTAVSALKYIQDGNLGFLPAMDFAEKALEQITALEQKD